MAPAAAVADVERDGADVGAGASGADASAADGAAWAVAGRPPPPPPPDAGGRHPSAAGASVYYGAHCGVG